MKQLSQTLSRKDAEKRIPEVRVEIDTELAALHQALIKKDYKTIKLCKQKLEELRREMLLLEI
jgi:16S rRNA U516 pseudouridylate synthase RsuA-like enzyme